MSIGAIALGGLAACRRAPEKAAPRADDSAEAGAGHAGVEIEPPGHADPASASANRPGAAGGSADPPSAPVPSPNGPGLDQVRGGGLASGSILDLGAAAPVAVRDDGVWILETDEQLMLANPARRASAGAPSAAAQGPALTRGAAYFIAAGRLVRRTLDRSAGRSSGPLEVLAEDAVDGTRVAALSLAPVAGEPARDLVAYIARPAAGAEDRRARLWAEHGAAAGGGRIVDLSEEGGGASSVALVASAGRVFAAYLDGRTAMSLLHARLVSTGSATSPAANRPPITLGPDVVAFVGGPPEAHTQIELAAGPGDEEATAFVPLARSTTSFGLFSVMLGRDPHMDAKAAWLEYPNGLDPAPVAAASFCGELRIALVRPEMANPEAARVLELRRLSRDGELSADSFPIAKAAHIDAVSLGYVVASRSARLAWIADGRLRAVDLSCAAAAAPRPRQGR